MTNRGHFYAVGVGPGSPDLLTLRAVDIISKADVLICPASAKKNESLALNIIKPWIKKQKIELVKYPMRKDVGGTWNLWEHVAKRVKKGCEQGKIIAQITLGDPLFYSTSCYLLTSLEKIFPKSHIHVVPGITAFQATGAKFGLPFVWQEDSFMVMPASDLQRIEQAISWCETLVLYKVGKVLKEVLFLLDKYNLFPSSYLAAYVEQEGEYLISNLKKDLTLPGYLVTLIIQTGHKSWNYKK
ncbi:precorrin-2 C20-methyltransferase /cobalt-factor II C20-methyltransferase [Desulfonauticus submarinus]|uniref:Precorrin-2 C20-methyltransferase /cobalt-factor II C20-methyltransferase n=1 Tax=Desulfonauticus submarinus TaxID=206665 RepID=A0A1H0BKZ8_9BACT|nr:precorrin-2 C(20)-methyltransferase [Desulfonauticus submarinus]SDN46330.1 precorrin-2 C20-methyltransferase /cobalt-factor II C20-methyltransferase [Desulfonauticus submarinus]